MHRQPFAAMQLDVFMIRVSIFFNPRVTFKEERELGRWWFGVVIRVVVAAHDNPLLTVQGF